MKDELKNKELETIYDRAFWMSLMYSVRDMDYMVQEMREAYPNNTVFPPKAVAQLEKTKTAMVEVIRQHDALFEIYFDEMKTWHPNLNGGTR